MTEKLPSGAIKFIRDSVESKYGFFIPSYLKGLSAGGVYEAKRGEIIVGFGATLEYKNSSNEKVVYVNMDRSVESGLGKYSFFYYGTVAGVQFNGLMGHSPDTNFMIIKNPRHQYVAFLDK